MLWTPSPHRQSRPARIRTLTRRSSKRLLRPLYAAAESPNIQTTATLTWPPTICGTTTPFTHFLWFWTFEIESRSQFPQKTVTTHSPVLTPRVPLQSSTCPVRWILILIRERHWQLHHPIPRTSDDVNTVAATAIPSGRNHGNTTLPRCGSATHQHQIWTPCQISRSLLLNIYRVWWAWFQCHVLFKIRWKQSNLF